MDAINIIELIDTKKTSSKKAGKTSKYRMGEDERKLPRPIVFWSDNERDAFRRNKIVQTRYNMLMDDIENQKRATQKSIRHEALKYRMKSGKYKQECQKIQNEASSTEEPEQLEKRECIEKKSSESSDCESDNESDSSSGTIPNAKTEGVITDHKRPSVKFSVYNELIPSDKEDKDNRVKESNRINLGNRSSSACVPRLKAPDLPLPYTKRSQSAVPELKHDTNVDQLISGPPYSSSRMINQKPLRKPNRLFFDKSIAAYELRKELQKLARIRKQGTVATTYTVTDALRDERAKYTASRLKVTEYLEKLEMDKRNSLVVNKWNVHDIEQDLHV